MPTTRLLSVPTLVWILGLVAARSQAQPLRAQPLTTPEVTARIGDPSWLLVDIRDSNAFNGWITDQEVRGGHIPGAVNLPWRWTQSHPAAVERIARTSQFSDHQLILYGDSTDEVHRMFGWLQNRTGLKAEQLFVYSEGIVEWSRNEGLAMQRLPRHEKLVPPDWVHRLSEAREPSTYRIVEVAWRNRAQYEQGHVPGAIYLDTDEIESEPWWNVVSAEQLEATLLSLGVTRDTLVVVYGRDLSAAARAAVIMMYAGVTDVRLLNGGFQGWKDAGFPLAAGHVPRQRASRFGGQIPLHPEWIVDTTRAQELLTATDARLVSIRSWSEHIGQTSGYAYIQPQGRIRGDVWGHGGSDRDHMEDFRNPDNTLRDYHHIAANWRDWDIRPEHRISFYCGTGWRASEAFFAAYLMGYDDISVYDGGWFEWSADPSRPIDKGVPATAMPPR